MKNSSHPTRGKPAGLPLVAIVLGGLLLAIVLIAADGGPRLQVTDHQGQILLDISLSADPTWAVHWNHSVTGILVSDYYRYEGEQMLLTETHTPAFDAGLGHIPGRGRLESDGANGYWIRDIDEPVPGNSYALRVGSMAVDHRIEHAGEVQSLSALVAGQRVTIAVIR